jgi:hypothetical protein
MLAAFVAVVITAFVVTIWLLTIASHAKPGTDQANARLDAVRTGLAAGAGAGAAVGLMLAFRRQHHQEVATVLTDRDATERRITELYTKAVEQLGNDRAPVRLGGLYALERVRPSSTSSAPTCACRSSPPRPPRSWTRSLRPLGSKKGRCVLPRSVFSLSICVTKGLEISAPPILRAHVSGLTSASISLAPRSSTSPSETA